jgi:hypothetical protein
VNSPTDVWAVGDQGVTDSSSSTLIEHWNGTAWSIVPSPSPGSDSDLTGVTTSNAANDVWAVGYYDPTGTAQGQTLTLNWNGTTWTRRWHTTGASGLSLDHHRPPELPLRRSVAYDPLGRQGRRAPNGSAWRRRAALNHGGARGVAGAAACSAQVLP